MIRVTLSALLAVTLLAACGKTEEKTVPAKAPAAAEAGRGPAPSPTSSDQTVTADGAVSTVGGSADKIATPPYAPIYPGASVTTSVVGESGVGRGGTVVYRTDIKPEAVIAFYEDRVKAVGKPITMNQDMGGNVHMLTAGDSGDGKGAVQVIASPSGKGAEVQLTWSDE